VETAIDSLFLLEVLTMFVASPARSRFFKSMFNVIDVLACLPLVLRVAISFNLPRPGSTGSLWLAHWVLVCAVPVVRLLKTLRRFEKFPLLVMSIKLAAEALPILLYTLVVLTLTFAAAIYAVEPRDNVPSVPTAVWLVLVTTTTVGYGDVTPQSPAGSVIVGCLVVMSVLYMAMPLGIVGEAFNKVWRDRDRIVLLERTRLRLNQWGFAPKDIPAIFQYFDTHDNGYVDLIEFTRMMSEMGIGLSEDRIHQLFEVFDPDGHGYIDDKVFVRVLFPDAFYRLYGMRPSIERTSMWKEIEHDYQSEARKSRAWRSMDSNEDLDELASPRCTTKPACPRKSTTSFRVSTKSAGSLISISSSPKGW